MKLLTFVSFSAAILSAASLLQGAQQPSPAVVEATKAAFNTPTNVPGVMTTSVKPPLGFDPLTATEHELASFGFPPRPDSQSEPKAFATWARAMQHSKIQVMPSLQMTNIFHGPVKKATSPANAAVSNSLGYSTNWSGAVDFGGASSYNHTNSFYYIYSQYVVPRPGFCANASGWNYSSSWVGIDGDGSNDVLQTGTESDEYCAAVGAQPSSSFYSAWIEWYPYSETRISSSTFPVNPGDDIFVEIWNTSATQGYAYLVDYQQNKYVQFSLTPPSGTSLVGNSAEWIVEAPSVGGGLAVLSNYISDFFAECYSSTWAGTGYYPGSSSTLFLDMITSSSQIISYPILEGSTGLWFQDSGVAR